MVVLRRRREERLFLVFADDDGMMNTKCLVVYLFHYNVAFY
jgi:hypothetical protein